MRIPSHVLIAMMLLGPLAACETTGDPRQGGLFGWSASKADARQQALQAQTADANGQAQYEQERSQQLAAQSGVLQSQTQNLQGQLDNLLSDNAKLQKQLEALSRRKKLSSGELARVQRELAQNQNVRQAATQPVSSSARAEQQSRDLVSEQNRRLKELLFEVQQ